MQEDESWRSSTAYEYVDDLQASDLAWEFLRRNEDYRREYKRLQSKTDSSDPAKESFAQRWGLSFRARSRSPRVVVGSSLDAECGPLKNSSHIVAPAATRGGPAARNWADRRDPPSGRKRSRQPRRPAF
ncbi:MULTISPECIES: DUF6499 domain-containing protein [unclassified Bradyrhizobium]|uniref:transcriptional regulator domain-containing protein n=1 Tax=unclassified Bradyrhizobium TaxID=2631580 RepID=UPI001E29A323|nr:MULTISPECIES: DUF6499 domain-containing protein [unclassified Bradyrhizobium]